jgi:hypothetical protein
LEASKYKEDNEVSHMNAGRGWIEADIERYGLSQGLAKLCFVSGLGNKSAPFKVID